MFKDISLGKGKTLTIYFGGYWSFGGLTLIEINYDSSKLFGFAELNLALLGAHLSFTYSFEPSEKGKALLKEWSGENE